MPDFVKNPKFIAGTLVILWVVWVIYANFQLNPIQIKILPFAADLQFRVSAVIIGAAIFGAVVTLAVQFLWKRRSSKNGSASVTA